MPPIDATTTICGILGHPVQHSLSPTLHNAAFAELGLNFAYVAHDVRPEDLPAAISGARALGYRGLSVTIPHKSAALASMDEVDATARGIGCINTVVNEGGRLKGFNSDGRGALHALINAGADPRGRTVVVLGSGGAARAVAMTLAVESAPEVLRILGVVPAELGRLVADIHERARVAIESADLTEQTLSTALRGADQLLNCTPVGMHPHEGRSLVPAHLLRSDLTVFDAVYNPRRTQLIQDAERAGCRVVSGVEMFLGQAVVQFELWTGKPAPLAVMRRVVEERL